MKRIKLDKNGAKRIARNVIYPLIALGIVLAVWAIWATAKDNPLVLPMPSAVLARFFALGGEKGSWESVGWSLLRSAPTVAVILIFYAFMSSNQMAIAVGFLIAFPIMYSAFYSAITGVDKDLLEMAKVYKVKPLETVRSIYLPSVAPCLFDTSKSTLSLTLKVVVAAEILACVSKSIGGKIQTANATFEIEYLLAWTLVAIVFGFVLEGVVAIAKKAWEATR